MHCECETHHRRQGAREGSGCEEPRPGRGMRQHPRHGARRGGHPGRRVYAGCTCGCHDQGHQVESCTCGCHDQEHRAEGCTCGCHDQGHHAEGCTCGCHGRGHGRSGARHPGGMVRRFYTRKERVAWLRSYLEALEAEAQGVRERIEANETPTVDETETE